MNDVFYFLYREALTSGALLTLDRVVHNPTFIIRLSYTGPPVIIDPGPSTRHLWTAPKPQRPLKLIKLANPKPAYPASPFLPVQTIIKTLAHTFPLFLCVLTEPRASLCVSLWFGMHGPSPWCLRMYQTIFSMAVVSLSVSHTELPMVYF